MDKPRLAFFAPSVGSGMAPLILATCEALREQYTIELFVPAHFPYREDWLRHTFLPSASRRSVRALKMMVPASYGRLIREMKTFSPDLVHIFNSEGYPWSIALSLWCQRNDVPLVVTMHDPKAHPGSFFAWLNERLGAITTRRATLVHIFYEKFAEVMKSRYGRPVFVADYVPISRFYLVHREPHIQRETLVLQFGRLEYYKGIDVLVDAAQFLPSDVKIAIAGPGRLDDAVKKKITNQPERFEIHEGFLSDAEVARMFQRARVLTLPYREVTQSQLPAIAAEFGVVTVASDIGFFCDDVPRFGGVLTRLGDPLSLAQGIMRAMTATPQLPSHFGTACVIADYDRMYHSAIQVQQA